MSDGQCGKAMNQTFSGVIYKPVINPDLVFTVPSYSIIVPLHSLYSEKDINIVIRDNEICGKRITMTIIVDTVTALQSKNISTIRDMYMICCYLIITGHNWIQL